MKKREDFYENIKISSEKKQWNKVLLELRIRVHVNNSCSRTGDLVLRTINDCLIYYALLISVYKCFIYPWPWLQINIYISYQHSWWKVNQMYYVLK